jgi:hypothetical protein
MIRRLALPQLSNRDRRALTLGVWLIATLLISGAVVKPYVGAVLDERDGLAADRALLARERAAVLNLGRDRATLEGLTRKLSLLAPRLFGGSDAVTASAALARYVSVTAASTGLHVEQVETETRLDSAGVVRLAGAAERPSAVELRVSLRAHGDVVAIYDFLRAIESGRKLVRVSRLEIVRASDTDAFDGALTVTATLIGRARESIVPAAVDTAEEELP